MLVCLKYKLQKCCLKCGAFILNHRLLQVDIFIYEMFHIHILKLIMCDLYCILLFNVCYIKFKTFTNSKKSFLKLKKMLKSASRVLYILNT